MGTDRPAWRRPRGALERALRGASYEVLPLRGAEAAVVEHVPRTVPLTVTVTEAKGLTPTLELAERLSGHGFTATPHLAARLVRGDAIEPAGAFPDALSLLEALETTGQDRKSVV